ncbi:MAG: TatD family hydrolase [Pseudomonadota bacterium]|nr:hydrolase TatD [Pseudomonadales bacterium]MDY6921712.1 TatD family hydrolase [Pseudomonadota bacterium]
MLVDSHCHLDKLDLTPYNGDLQPALDAAFARQVSQLLCIGIDLDHMDEVLALAERHPQVHASVGVHPLYRDSREPSVEELLQVAQHPRVVAIGETGLDYFYGEGDLSWQRERFCVHIEAARKSNLPLIIHTRGAKEDTLSLLREQGQGAVNGVLHCFTEDLDMAQQAVEMGFLISISGIVTFRNASALREVVRALPLERLLVETDAPWLAPVPHRGRKNEPQYVVEVAAKVAELKGCSLERVARVTTENYFRLFSKAQPQHAAAGH